MSIGNAKGNEAKNIAFTGDFADFMETSGPAPGMGHWPTAATAVRQIEEIKLCEYKYGNGWRSGDRYMITIEDKVLELVNNLSDFKGERVAAAPATDEQIIKFERIHELKLPCEIRELLKCYNGISLGPSTFYPLFSKSKDDCSMDWYLRERPEWSKKGWMPIADDGCGDVFILATSLLIPSTGTHPVFFLDQAEDAPTYVVASGVWRFLFFFLENERFYQRKQLSYWPFDKEKVVAIDPKIVECKGIPLPWEANDQH
ncbi:MAG TPA: SMI1/KNR4 family protein [Verrucomicrobiae bacterium]|nr:SMI1/KNR4 family protein [Verrucomicrobiae bacterium]